MQEETSSQSSSGGQDRGVECSQDDVELSSKDIPNVDLTEEKMVSKAALNQFFWMVVLK